MNIQNKIQPYKISPIKIDFQQEEWLKMLKLPLEERVHYSLNTKHFQYGQIVIQFLGINESEENYFDQLYDLANDDDLSIHILDHDKLIRKISRKHLQSIYQLYFIHQDQNLSPKRIVSYLKRLHLLPTYHNKAIDIHIRDSIVNVLEVYQQNHSDDLHGDTFRRVLTDLIKWTWNHLDPWLRQISLNNEVPHILWYGDMKESHRYFLYFLMKAGWDLLIFQPTGVDSFSMLQNDESKSLIQTYSNKTELKPFPKHRSKKATIAYKASEQINELLHHDHSDLYKPWQFQNHIPYSVPLKTTYDEIFLLLKEPAFIRPNFNIKDNKIYIPVLFAKVSGISTNKDQYWDRLNQLINKSDQTVFNQQFPFASTMKPLVSYYNESIEENGRLNPEKIMSNSKWKYKDLSQGIQRGIASAIARYTENPLIKSLVHEDIENTKYFLFSQAISLPNQIIRLLQKFDYSQSVPRIVFYHNEKNGKLSRADAALLLFLHEFGADILVFNPTGQNDIEFYINENHFDNHRLDEMVFNQEFKESNLLHRFSNNLFKGWRNE